ncbi:hypothetical protein CERSUDRAFT_96787 [Gelatoporia subvermispora B]|uniref:Rab-GAP TBC domain-containing protein n=1 Tax=Ceriporiopsis subvermispora (strain B) TaxID=914234 RepID=M2QUB7_CERS8|nr:hypothetical protein CERSUDRAFT_96787 [Gelatoporia subvermispora B]
MSNVEATSTDTTGTVHELKQPDWAAARELSLRPGGFGAKRVELWPQLLNVEHPAPKTSELRVSEPSASAPDEASHESDEVDNESIRDTSTIAPHKDERQIQLDTDRSFVLYPVDDTEEKDHLQSQLNELIVCLFRKRQHLSYFQGYHDVISVVYLTLPRELQLPVAEKISLHRLRDSMGASLEPVVGLLRILKRIMHLADAEFATILERNAPLPYYALSSLLTLLSHDVPTLPLIQHVFDYLLSRPPIALVYLAAAVILTRREEAIMLEREGEEGMIHSLLTSLPDLYEETDEESKDEDTGAPPKGDGSISQDESSAQQSAPEGANNVPTSDGNVPQDPVERPHDDTMPSSIPNIKVEDEGAADASLESQTIGESDVKTEAPSEALFQSAPAIETGDTPPFSEKHEETAPPSPTLSIHLTSRPRIPLSSLLRQADDLYTRFPPTHPEVAVSSIMGPQSVMLTWSEDPSELPDDEEAERMVLRPELIVLPHIDQDEEVPSDEEDEKSTRSRRRGGKDRERRHRRKLRKPRRMGDVVLQRKTMVAGAVLVLGVAMAVYGIQSGGAANIFGVAGEGHRRHQLEKEWRRLSGFIGGAVIGVGERMFGGLLH